MVTSASATSADLAFSAVSSAQGVRLEVDSTSIPVSPDTVGGGPTAQTLLDSIGTSHAYAASPDPGSTLGTAGNLACGAAQLPLPPAACAYPLMAQTDRGQPPANQTLPGVTLHADSEDISAHASAQVTGGAGPQALSTSQSIVEPDGTVSTSADTHLDGLNIANVLVAQGVQSSAAVTRLPGGALKRSGTTTVSRITVAGFAFGYANGSLTIAGNPVSVPVGEVLTPLAAAGVIARLQAPTETKTGIVAAALTLSFTVPATPQTAPLKVTVGFGGADASITSSIVATQSQPSLTVAPTVAATKGPGRVAPSGPSPSLTPLAAGSQALATGAPAAGAPALATGARAASASTPGPLAFRTGYRRPLQDSIANLYLAIVAAGLLALGASTAVRLFGVRLAWIS
jgi:hypothetical protein